MKVSSRLGIGILIFTALCTSASARRPEAPYWLPDETTLKTMETGFVMPTLRGWPPPGSLQDYARYYTGWTSNGHRIIYGDLWRGRAGDTPGIHIVAFGDRHMGATGGGCSQIQVWYDLDDHKFLEAHCYGLG
jgi:hypothetical protein